MSSSNKKPSTKVASSLGESALLMEYLSFLLNTANVMAFSTTNTPRNDRTMNDAYSTRIESHN